MILVIGGGLAVLVFALHIVLRFVASDADPFVLPIATLLTGVGIAEIYRHRHRRASHRLGRPTPPSS